MFTVQISDTLAMNSDTFLVSSTKSPILNLWYAVPSSCDEMYEMLKPKSMIISSTLVTEPGMSRRMNSISMTVLSSVLGCM